MIALLPDEEILFSVETPLGFRVRTTVRYTHMAQVKVYYDRIGNTLTVWFGNPEDEVEVEETGEEMILMKDKQGRVIGFEKLNFLLGQAIPFRVAFETVAA
jgi:uncharacterized protein YuzE